MRLGFFSVAISASDFNGEQELKFTGLQLLPEKSDLFLNRAVLFQPAFDTVDGVQGRGVITVKRFPDGLQGRIRVTPRQINSHLAGSDEMLFAGAGNDVLQADIKIFADQFFDNFNRDALALAHNIFYDTFSQLEIDRDPQQ